MYFMHKIIYFGVYFLAFFQGFHSCISRDKIFNLKRIFAFSGRLTGEEIGSELRLFIVMVIGNSKCHMGFQISTNISE